MFFDRKYIKFLRDQIDSARSERDTWQILYNDLCNDIAKEEVKTVDGIYDFLRDNCYGPWKVINTTKHKDGTVVETAQRGVKRVKNDA